MIHDTLHQDLHLSITSARRVPKLLNQGMKNERVRIYKASWAMVYCHSMAMLDWIVTMDQSTMSFHKTQTKQQSE